MNKIALFLMIILMVATGCASRTIQEVAAEEGVAPTVELLYFGAIVDYNRLKADALAFAVLPSTTSDEVAVILLVINGGTSDRGCLMTSTEPRCLDGADGMIRQFEQLRSAGGATSDGYQSVSSALALAAGTIRATTGGVF